MSWILISFTQNKDYFPELHWNRTLNKTYQIDFSNITQFRAENQQLIEVLQNGTVVYLGLFDSKYVEMQFFNPQNNVSFYSNYTFVDVAIDLSKSQDVYFLIKPLTGNQTKVLEYRPITKYQLNLFIVNEFEIKQNTQFQTTNETFFFINPSQNNSTAVISRMFQSEKYNLTRIEEYAESIGMNSTLFQQIPSDIETNIFGDSLRAKTCKKSWIVSEYLIIWNVSSYIEVYQCDYFDCQLNGKIENDFNDSWVVNDITWGSDCDYFYIAYDETKPATKYNSTCHNMSNFTTDIQVLSFKPITEYYGGILYSNSSFLYYKFQNHSMLHQYNGFGDANQFSGFMKGSRSIFINNEDSIQIFRFQCSEMLFWNSGAGICNNCSSSCQGCYQANGNCIKCFQNYIIDPNNRRQCILPPLLPPLSKNSQTVFINQTIPTNQSLDIANETPTSITQKYGAVYGYEEAFAEVAVQGFEVIGTVVYAIFSVLSVMPLAWLFMAFMNFWNICSFYLFLNADIPEYLKIVIKIIYQNVNTSFFNFTQFSQKIYPIPQKLEYLAQQYSISSHFLAMNLENFIFFFGCAILLKVFVFMLGYMPTNNKIRKMLEENLHQSQILTNQFISISSNFFMPFFLIHHKLNSSTFLDSSNLLLHTCFIGFSLIFPFLFIDRKTLNEIPQPKTSKQKEQRHVDYIKQKNLDENSQFIKNMEWLYVSNCNTMLPFLSIVGIPHLYYCFGFFFYSFGIWTAWKSHLHTLNQIILALYPFIFHLCFVTVSIFGSNSIFLKHHGSVMCTIILIIGAIHELLSLFFKVAIFIVRQIFQRCKKVESKQSNESEKDQEFQPNFLQTEKNFMFKFVGKLSPQNEINNENNEKKNKIRVKATKGKYLDNLDETTADVRRKKNQYLSQQWNLKQNSTIEFSRQISSFNVEKFFLSNKQENLNLENLDSIKNQQKFLKQNKILNRTTSTSQIKQLSEAHSSTAIKKESHQDERDSTFDNHEKANDTKIQSIIMDNNQKKIKFQKIKARKNLKENPYFQPTNRVKSQSVINL